VQSRYDELRQARTDVEARRAQLAVQLVKVKSEPDKVKKQADAVAGALAALEAESAKQLDTLRGLDGELAHQVKRRKELEEGRMNARLSLNRWREATGNEFNRRTDRNNRGDYKFLNYTLPDTQPEARHWATPPPPPPPARGAGTQASPPSSVPGLARGASIQAGTGGGGGGCVSSRAGRGEGCLSRPPARARPRAPPPRPG